MRLNWRMLRELSGITMGTSIVAFGLVVFLVPFKAAPGGISALSQILYYLFKIPMGTAMLMFNVPLFFIGVMTLGRMFGVKTLYAILSIGLFANALSSAKLASISWLAPFMYKINDQAWSFTSEPVLGVIAGALFLGTGLGIVFRFNGSCGSTDVPALLLKKYFGISIGTGYLLIDTFIIIGSGLVFKDGNLIFWALFALLITSKTTDYVMQGFPRAKAVFIVSDRADEIKKIILEEGQCGCTVFKGEGGHSGTRKDILYTVTHVHSLARIKEQMKRVDPRAFMTVSEVSEVHGERTRGE